MTEGGQRNRGGAVAAILGGLALLSACAITVVLARGSTVKKTTAAAEEKKAAPCERNTGSRRRRAEGFHVKEDEEEGGDLSSVIVENNPGNGDCLFHCFKDALAEIGRETTIRDLRAAAARAVTEDQFEILRVIYDTAVAERELEVVRDYAFMKGVRSLADLRKAMMKNTFWGEEIALTALERHTGLTAVVFSTHFNGALDFARREGSAVRPASGLYIMLVLDNAHYQLVRFNDRTAMRRKQLPGEVRAILRELRKT